jgi:hypothetical protein
MSTEKTVWVSIPLKIPASWERVMDAMRARVSDSKASLYRRALRFGLPRLAAEIDATEREIAALFDAKPTKADAPGVAQDGDAWQTKKSPRPPRQHRPPPRPAPPSRKPRRPQTSAVPRAARPGR